MKRFKDHLYAQKTKQYKCNPRGISTHKTDKEVSCEITNNRHAHMKEAEDSRHEQCLRMPFMLVKALYRRYGEAIHRQPYSHYDNIRPIHKTIDDLQIYDV